MSVGGGLLSRSLQPNCKGEPYRELKLSRARLVFFFVGRDVGNAYPSLYPIKVSPE